MSSLEQNGGDEELENSLEWYNADEENIQFRNPRSLQDYLYSKDIKGNELPTETKEGPVPETVSFYGKDDIQGTLSVRDGSLVYRSLGENSLIDGSTHQRNGYGSSDYVIIEDFYNEQIGNSEFSSLKELLNHHLSTE